MKSVPSVSIGIPAYNEAANIKQLLELILSQKETNFTLEKIFILSDGSTDATAKEVATLKDKRIIFKDDKKRLGKTVRLNQIFQLNTSDVLVLLDADVIFKDALLFSKLLKKVDFQKIGIAAINARSLPAHTFFEHSLETSVDLSRKIAQSWNNGDNYLSFKGCFLALSKAYAKTIQMPKKLTNNDAYLYFDAKQKGFGAAYVKDCAVYYKSPFTLSDHIKQSSRFQASKQELGKYFSKDVLSYSPPRKIVVKCVSESFVTNPLYFISYLGIHALSKLRKEQVTDPTWNIAGSTKQKIALSQ